MTMKDLALQVLLRSKGDASERASAPHQGDARDPQAVHQSDASGRCPKCSELIRRGAQDALCGRCPSWPASSCSPEEYAAYRRELEEPAAGPVYVRADGARQCQSCRDLTAKGVAILHCGACDLLTDCPACIRINAPCHEHYQGPA